MKKLLLSLGSVAAIATPVAAVVACDEKDALNTHAISVESKKSGFMVKLSKDENIGMFIGGDYYIESGKVGTELKVYKYIDPINRKIADITLKVKKPLSSWSHSDSFDINGEDLIGTDLESVHEIPEPIFVISYNGVSEVARTKSEAKDIIIKLYNYTSNSITSKDEAANINVASDVVLKELQTIMENIGLVVTGAKLKAQVSVEPREIESITTVEK